LKGRSPRPLDDEGVPDEIGAAHGSSPSGTEAA
jgi:hypothetical protein